MRAASVAPMWEQLALRQALRGRECDFDEVEPIAERLEAVPEGKDLGLCATATTAVDACLRTGSSPLRNMRQHYGSSLTIPASITSSKPL